MLPETIIYECHVHPLNLLDSLVEEKDDSDEYYCDACEEERRPGHSVYYCAECN